MNTPRTFPSSLAAVLGAVALGLAGTVIAEVPEKQVEYVIPFGPGGESDISARLQQPYFKEKFGQDMVITYKPGGGGALGWSQLNDMNADGHSIMGINLPHIIIQPAQKEVGYTTEDITAIHMFHYTPDAIVVNASSPYETLADLVEDAETNPGKVTLSGSGKATANHLAQIRFDEMAGIETTYVPFKGTGAAVTALLGNQVKAEWGYTTVGATQGDQVRLLAVAMEERHPLFPDVPTFTELGYDMVGGAYRGIAVPSGADEATRTRWADMIAEINADEKFRQQMLDGGFAMLDVTYEGMEAFMQERSEEYLKTARDAGLVK